MKLARHGNYEQTNCPILEFDPSTEAMIEPGLRVEAIDAPEHCVVCFFREVIAKLVREGRARAIAHQKYESGLHPVYELEVDGRRLALFNPGVGAPMAASMLEEAIALGCRKFVACGGAGVLRDIPAGTIVVPSAAVRDEGTSYHYLPPSREVEANLRAMRVVETVLKEHNRNYIVAKTWTTDAPYRETRAKATRREKEGCATVEMEAAALFAVARFRAVAFVQLLYAGDDLSAEVWDPRGWGTPTPSREQLFWLAAQSCFSL
jgi:uridine phosphorylase